VAKAAIYSNRVSFGEGLDSVMSFVRYALRSSKACCYFVPHSKLSELLRVLKKGNPLSADLEMNLLSAANLPVSIWTCFWLEGGFMFTTAAIFSGFASIPLTDTRHPNSFPFLIPKMHFSRFSLWPLFSSF
jgi:hypothetical protein